MATYLDDLTQWSNRAIVVIADLAAEAATAISGGGEANEQIDKAFWYNVLLVGANDTDQDIDVRLTLLTYLVDGARLETVPDPAGVYNLYQPIAPTSVGTVAFADVTGSILSNASAAAQFALYLQLAGGTMTGPLLITPATRIDASTLNGALRIGTVSAGEIIIGRTGQEVSMPGTITDALWDGLAIPISKGGTGVTAVGTALQVLRTNAGATGTEWATITPGTGDVVGPGSATDNAIARFDSTTGKLIQNSVVTIGDTGNIAGLATISSGLWNGTVIGRPYGGFGNAMSNAPGGNFVYGYDVGDDESQFWTIGSRLTYGTQELNVNPVLTLTSVAASTFLSAGTYLQAGVASSATGQLRLAHASTANLTTITAGNAASALTFVWPVVNPTVGQVLTASAPSGSTVTLSWSSVLTNPLDNVGQIIYGGVAGAPTKLAANLVNAKRFLTSTAIAGIGQAPVWSTVSGSDLASVVPLSLGGTGAALVDPNANRIMGWDDLTTSVKFFTIGAGLSYDAGTTTLSVDATGIVNTVTGTANRITITGTANDPIINIAATYVGQSSITTLGTVGTGDWQAAIIGGEFGGTDFDVTTLTPGNSIRVNGAGTAWEEFTPGTGSGTVTTVSVVSANGFAGTVATATTTPAITLTTTITGVLKGNGTAISAATPGTDYVAGGAITTSGLTMATARLLGRTTASTGAVEEITVGAGLTLSAGSLVATAIVTQTQSFTAQTSVTVTHNLGRYPLVQVIDNTGAKFDPSSITHASVNAFTVVMSSSTTGNILYI